MQTLDCVLIPYVAGKVVIRELCTLSGHCKQCSILVVKVGLTLHCSGIAHNDQIKVGHVDELLILILIICFNKYK